jgi:hypothetical protein
MRCEHETIRSTSSPREQLGETAGAAANTPRLTNIGTFRAYVVEYLRAHPDIANGMSQLVRQLHGQFLQEQAGGRRKPDRTPACSGPAAP